MPLTVPFWYQRAGPNVLILSYPTLEQQQTALAKLQVSSARGIAKKDLDLVPVFKVPDGTPESLLAHVGDPVKLTEQLAALKTIREACTGTWRTLFLHMTSPMFGTDEDKWILMMALVGPGAAYRSLQQICLGDDPDMALAGKSATLAMLIAEPVSIGPLVCEIEWGGENCAACGKSEPPLRCSRCQCTHYCDVTCQQTDWAMHKRRCGTGRRKKD